MPFKLNIVSRQSQIRQRLNEKNEKDLKKTTSIVKNRKKLKERKECEDEVPKFFVELIQELGFGEKEAKALFENKEKWAYLKSDRLIRCTHQGENFVIKLKRALTCFLMILSQIPRVQILH